MTPKEELRIRKEMLKVELASLGVTLLNDVLYCYLGTLDPSTSGILREYQLLLQEEAKSESSTIEYNYKDIAENLELSNRLSNEICGTHCDFCESFCGEEHCAWAENNPPIAK